jgi:HEAT repeat protein
VVQDLGADSSGYRAEAAKVVEATPVDPAKRKEVALALDAALQKPEGVQLAASAAASALKKWGGPENFPTLTKLLKGKDPGGQAVACVVLKEIGTKDVIPDLQAAAAKGPPDVAQLAKDAIAAIQGR